MMKILAVLLAIFAILFQQASAGSETIDPCCIPNSGVECLLPCNHPWPGSVDPCCIPNSGVQCLVACTTTTSAPFE